MSTMASQIASASIVYSTVVQAQIKEHIKAPRHWPLWRGEFPAQRASNTEKISIWLRHHADMNFDINQKEMAYTHRIALQWRHMNDQASQIIVNSNVCSTASPA